MMYRTTVSILMFLMFISYSNEKKSEKYCGGDGNPCRLEKKNEQRLNRMKPFIAAPKPGRRTRETTPFLKRKKSGSTHADNSPSLEKETLGSVNHIPSTTVQVVPEKTTFYKMLQSSSDNPAKKASSDLLQQKQASEDLSSVVAGGKDGSTLIAKITSAFMTTADLLETPSQAEQSNGNATEDTLQPEEQISAPDEFVEDGIHSKMRVNKAARAAAVVCGTCKCDTVGGVTDITECSVNSNGYVEIIGINSYPVVTLENVFKDSNYVQKSYYFKDNSIQTILDFSKIPHQSKIILEMNEKLHLESLLQPPRFHTVEFREKGLLNFEDRSFTTDRLIFKDLKSSKMSLFPVSQQWFNVEIKQLTIEGETADISPFTRLTKLHTVTLKGVTSSLGMQLLPLSFLAKDNALEYLIISNTNNAVLPSSFAEETRCKVLNLTAALANIGENCLNNDVLTVLNGKYVTSTQLSTIIGSVFEDCHNFCSNADCGNDPDQINRLNCAICVRNIIGENEKNERGICDYPLTTGASTTLPSPTTSSLDYYIDYWPNEGMDYLDL